jgi:hypothetical protein
MTQLLVTLGIITFLIGIIVIGEIFFNNKNK